MITVKIPAAIRKHSPVLWTLGPDSTVSGGVVHIHGDGSLSVASRQGGLLYEDDEVPRDAVALVISDPTGAAHLAWWLLYQTPSRTPEQHAARLEAIGWTANGYAVHVDLAARGLGVGSVALGFLRDYAHHIVGVTNG